MKVSVTNLGAIKEATIELGGLTIFVGPNGTGKSYLAKVIYGLQRHETLTSNFIGHEELFYQIFFGKSLSTPTVAIKHLKRLSPDALQSAMPALANLHGNLFKEGLGEYFNDDSNLFANTSITFSDFLPLTNEQLRNIIDTSIKSIEDLRNSRSKDEISVALVVWTLYLHVFWFVGGGLADYFPAARSNFMMTYKALYRARADEHVGLETISDKLLLASKGSHTRKTGTLIRYDRPTEDFISHLYDLDSSYESSLAGVSGKLQSQLYGGDRLVVEQPEGALPDFRYQIDGSDSKIRLHLTSSMVTETTPLLIGLRHWVMPNSLVIIDEPESHLHPEAQKALVNGLAEAVNQGLRVIFITHSPYILSCVNNLIKFDSVIKKFPEDADVLKLKHDHPNMVALEKKVSAYHFGKDGIVKDIVLKSGLIDEAEFTEPFDRINEIYEAMRDIEWEHRE